MIFSRTRAELRLAGMGARLEPFPSGGRDVGVVERTSGSCFNCPITLVAMNDPVVLVESGFTYERSAIERWLRDHDTGEALEAKALERLITLKLLLMSFHHARQIHSRMPSCAEDHHSWFPTTLCANAAHSGTSSGWASVRSRRLHHCEGDLTGWR